MLVTPHDGEYGLTSREGTLSMIRLNCESLEAAIESTSVLLNRPPRDLERCLLDFSEDRLVAQSRSDWADPDEIILQEALGVNPATLASVPEVLWFHATRAPPGTNFSEGLLPTNQIAPRLEAYVKELAQGIEETGAPCIDDGALFRLDQKLRGGAHAGPFAFMIRDVATGPSCARDFTRLAPEVVEELAYCLDSARSQAICEAYRSATRRCLVWFVARNQSPKYLRRAVLYAYLKLHQADVDLANANYSGQGKGVPHSDIVRVEFL